VAIKLGKILGSIADVLPFGAVAKSIIKGAGSLLLKKAAKKVGIDIEPVLEEASKMAEYDQKIKMALINEEKERRAHELAFFGRFSELDEKTKKLRSMMRPMVTIGLVGFYLLGLFVGMIQQIIPSDVKGFEFTYIHPDSLVEVTKWIVAFWFTSRGIEKIAEIVKR
jgi:hypothetical protein